MKQKLGKLSVVKIWILAFLLLCGLCTIHVWREELDVNIVDPAELNYSFDSGTWVFGISYENSSEKNYAQIWSPDSMDRDGNVGKVYATVELPCEENRVSAEVTFEEYETNVQIRLVRQEGTARLTEVAYRNAKKYNDALIWYLLFALGVVGTYAWMKRLDKEGREIFVCLAGVVFLFMLPYMNSFLTMGHDLDFHLLRIEGIYQALKCGEFPVMVNPAQSNGFGYITPVMYPQLLLYIPAVFRLLGMSLLNSYKLLVLISTVITVAVAYFSFKNLLKSPWAGMLAASLYTLGLYRMTNVYLRASVGEYLATAFLPLAFYGMYEILAGNHRKWIWAALGITLTFQQHIITTEILLLFTFLAFLLCLGRLIREPARFLSLGKAAVVTVLLNLGTIIPMLSFMGEDFVVFTNNEIRYIPDVVVYLSEVFATFVKMEGGQVSRGSTAGEMPLSVGGILPMAVIGFGVFLYHKKERIRQDEDMRRLAGIGGICILTGALAIWMTMWVFPWTVFTKYPVIKRLVGSVQFLSRFLMAPALTFCVVAGILAVFLIREYPQKRGLLIGGMYLIVIFSCIYPLESTIQNESYRSREEVATVSYADDLYLYQGDSQEPLKEMGKRIWVSEDAEIICRNLSKKGNRVECELEILQVGEDGYVELPIYYYPNYEVRLNGKQMPLEKGANGLVRVGLEAGCESGRLVAGYKMPVAWRAGKIVSLVVMIGMTGILGKICDVWRHRNEIR